MGVCIIGHELIIMIVYDIRKTRCGASTRRDLTQVRCGGVTVRIVKLEKRENEQIDGDGKSSRLRGYGGRKPPIH